MLSDTTIDTGTIQVYRETEFRVLGDTPATLNVDAVCADLAGMHRAHRVDCSAFITACNPYSEPFDETANAQRQSALARELNQRGLDFIDAIGQHPATDSLEMIFLGVSAHREGESQGFDPDCRRA